MVPWRSTGINPRFPRPLSDILLLSFRCWLPQANWFFDDASFLAPAHFLKDSSFWSSSLGTQLLRRCGLFLLFPWLLGFLSAHLIGNFTLPFAFSSPEFLFKYRTSSRIRATVEAYFALYRDGVHAL